MLRSAARRAETQGRVSKHIMAYYHLTYLPKAHEGRSYANDVTHPQVEEVPLVRGNPNWAKGGRSPQALPNGLFPC